MEPFVTRSADGCYAPRCFRRTSAGWYLNDSPDPNLARGDGYTYFALRDLAAGEVLLTR